MPAANGWSAADDAREARQRGMARFATIVGVWFGALGLLFTIVTFIAVLPSGRWIERAASPLGLVGLATPIALMGVASLGRGSLREGWAAGVETALMALPVVHGVATVVSLPFPVARGDLVVALVATMLSLLRALLVPSTSRRTAVLAAVAFVPAVIAALIVGGRIARDDAAVVTLVVAQNAVWALATVAISAYGSHVVYAVQATNARTLGPYDLHEELGVGGMGVVYRAEHRALRRAAAVKLFAATAHDPRALERFEREVMQTSRLSHPNTITVYDYGRTSDGSLYYAMELVDGVDLERLVREHGPQLPRRVVHILTQVCASLAEAHELGLVHRDIKPANVMLCRRGGVTDVVKVLDFGLVRDVRATERDLTHSNVVLGTPEYCSPEMIEAAADVGPASDLYSVGCLAYFLLTAKPPFVADSLIDLLRQHLYLAPIPPTAHADVPDELERIVLACLSKRPADRPSCARALAETLARSVNA